MGERISDEELMRCREAFAAAIGASRVRRSEETADHYVTMARMRHANPDDALLIARDYAERRGFTKTLEQIEAIIRA